MLSLVYRLGGTIRPDTYWYTSVSCSPCDLLGAHTSHHITSLSCVLHSVFRHPYALHPPVHVRVAALFGLLACVRQIAKATSDQAQPNRAAAAAAAAVGGEFSNTSGFMLTD